MAMSDLTRLDGEGERDPPFGDGDSPEVTPFGDEEANDDTSDLSDADRAGADPAGTTQLELENDDESRLPWLEGADDEEDYSSGNTAQLLGFVLLGLVALGVIVGGIWWFSNRDSEGEQVANGSVIEAPDAPYKEKPENPGGKTFEGTGDSSFAVSEGQSRPAQLGGDSATPKPGFETVEKAPVANSDAKSDPVAEEKGASSDTSGIGVQVGAYSTRAAAEAGWNSLVQQHSVLSGMRYRIVEGKADIGTVQRLQALPGDAGAANALCGKLKAAGLNCYVKK